jgi:NADH pyrophosphatase NudC (nudix superfamily)
MVVVGKISPGLVKMEEVIMQDVVLLIRAGGLYVAKPATDVPDLSSEAVKSFVRCRNAEEVCQTLETVLAQCPSGTRNHFSFMTRCLNASRGYQEATFQGLTRARQDHAEELDRLVKQAVALESSRRAVRFCPRETAQFLLERELSTI